METEKIDLVAELNKLVIINNDRTVGYEKAAMETHDNVLKQLFTKFAAQSRNFNAQLRNEISSFGGKAETGTTTSGKFYRAWMDIKSALSSNDKKTIVSSCEFGEDVAKKTYKDLIDENHINGSSKELVSNQYSELKKAHDEIKSLRDSL